jgi:CRP/FNR family transcriptional regulator
MLILRKSIHGFSNFYHRHHISDLLQKISRATFWYRGRVIHEESYLRSATTFPVLAELESGHREAVLSEGANVRFERGSLLFDVGQECEGLGLVLEGSVRVSCLSEGGREIVLYRVRPGQTCTITASCLVSEQPFAARGVVEENTTGLFIPSSTFRRLLRESNPFRNFVLGIFTARIDHLMELINQVAFNKLDERIAARLLELGPMLHMTHQDLADEVGSTREMVSRILESFADRGLVVLSRRRIEVPDLEALRNALGQR